VDRVMDALIAVIRPASVSVRKAQSSGGCKDRRGKDRMRDIGIQSRLNCLLSDNP